MPWLLNKNRFVMSRKVVQTWAGTILFHAAIGAAEFDGA